MSYKKNIKISFVSQIYVILIGILVVPFYISELGPEVYGLIGFFSMLQIIFNLLDIGLTPTISRETTVFKSSTNSNVINYIQLVKTLYLLFFIVAFIASSTLFLMSNFIATEWLNVEELPIESVSFAIKVMAISIGLKWMTGLSRGVINGNEKLVWLGWFNIIIATLRFLVVFPVLWGLGNTPNVFFSYQLFIAIIEFYVLRKKSKGLIPQLNINDKAQLKFSLNPIKKHLTFSLSIALTSILWVVVTQTDKIIMSKILTLEYYGYFTLVILISSGLMTLSGPISIPLMPRLVSLNAQNNRSEFIKVYRNATKLISIIIGPICFLIVLYADQILLVWTQDKNITDTISPTLKLYALGYGLLVFGAFPYYLQYGIGKLRLHIIGSLTYVILLLPLLWLLVINYNMIGAGYAWLLVSGFYFILMPLIVHNSYFKGLHLKWLIQDIFKVLFLPLIFLFLSKFFFQDSSRVFVFLQLIFLFLISVLLAFLSSRNFKLIQR